MKCQPPCASGYRHCVCTSRLLGFSLGRQKSTLAGVIPPSNPSSPWSLGFITFSMHGERRDFQVTLRPTGKGTSDIPLLSMQLLGFTWHRYILLNLQVNLLGSFSYSISEKWGRDVCRVRLVKVQGLLAQCCGKAGSELNTKL